MKTSEEYQKEKLERLESFERRVHQTIEYVGVAMQWVWVILGISLPLFLWYHPGPENGGIQAVILAVVIWVLFAMAQALKAIGKLEK